jgi:site-specific recombinase XerD
MPDLYNYSQRLNRKLEEIKNSKEISKHNKEKIIQFQRSCLANGLSKARMLRYLNDIPRVAKKLDKDFEKVNKTDIEKIMAEIETMDLAPATKTSYAVSLKKFYKWLNGGEEYPKCVKWLRTTEKENNNKLPEELLTDEEVKKIIEVALNSRDRGLISTLWESGCRIGELLTMKIKHVSFEKGFTRISINGKTGMRRVPLVDSTPYLAEWFENHPYKNDPNAPLWISIGTVNHHKPFEYAACRKMLKELATKAGITKAVNPHALRHGRATINANHFTEAQMNQYFGWKQGSDISRVYVHMSGRDVDSAVLKMKGLKTQEETVEKTLSPKKCPRCGIMNKSIGKFCTRCGMALDLKVAMELKDASEGIDEYFAKILEDDDIKSLIVSKLKGMANLKED